MSQCLSNIARGAEHTVAGCRYQCNQRRGLTAVSSAAPGSETAVFHCSLRVVTPAWCVNVTGPSRAGGMQQKLIEQKKIGLRQKGQSRREVWNSFFGGRSAQLARGVTTVMNPASSAAAAFNITHLWAKLLLKGSGAALGPS